MVKLALPSVQERTRPFEAKMKDMSIIDMSHSALVGSTLHRAISRQKERKKDLDAVLG